MANETTGVSMEEQIGSAAGQVWTYLAKKKSSVSLTDLPKLTDLKPNLAYMGLGWLAREGKLCYETKAGKTLVGLVPTECCL
ncbi:MAG: winged helix-turn-helix domain-containing protein [Phycisphaerae bacterium]|nr:winged helix-turn-helix domain-containing protein [Phycisphaerae bacterium]